MKAFKVSVDYQTITGNPATARIKVMAHNEDDAGSRAIERVRKYKTCLKIEGGDVTDYYPPRAPAPIDWAKEAARAITIREKAIEYIEALPQEAIIQLDGLDALYKMQYERWVVTVGVLDEDQDLSGPETERMFPRDLPLQDLLRVCEIVEQSLASK